MCLLAVLKILINLTHESDLGSHRLGEQKNVMTHILNIILRVSGIDDPLPQLTTHILYPRVDVAYN